MISLDKKRIIDSASIFANAMYSDDLHVYLFPNEDTRKLKLKYLYKYILTTRLNDIYSSSDNFEGLSIWEKPFTHHSGVSIKEIFYGIPLVFQLGLKTLFKAIQYQLESSKIRSNLITDPYWYLSLVAVSPLYQGKGFASKLIKPILEKANQEKVDVYIETQNANNVTIYEKYGFKLIHSQKICNSEVNHYCMIKKHLTTAST